MTSIEKGLNSILELNPKLEVPPQMVKTIAKMANGDMSAAINILRTVPKVRDRNVSQDLVGKDLNDTNLFHRFGKIMYNKRKLDVSSKILFSPEDKVDGKKEGRKAKEKDSIRYEGEEFDKHKNEMYFDLFDTIRRQNNFSRLSQRDFRG